MKLSDFFSSSKPKPLDQSIADWERRVAVDQEKLLKVQKLDALKKQDKAVRKRIQSFAPSNRTTLIILALVVVVILAMTRGCKI